MMTTFDDVFSNAFTNSETPYEPITIGDLIESKDNAIASYAKAWENFTHNDDENIDVDKHISFLKTAAAIEEAREDYNSDTRIMSEEYVNQVIEDHIREEYYDMVDQAENSYDWPYNHLEFDFYEAVQEKLNDSEEMTIGNKVYYSIPDIFDYL